MKPANRAALIALAGAVSAVPLLASAASAQGLLGRRGGASPARGGSTTVTPSGSSVQNRGSLDRGSLGETARRFGDRSDRPGSVTMQSGGENGGSSWGRNGRPSNLSPRFPSGGEGFGNNGTLRDRVGPGSRWPDGRQLGDVTLPPRGSLPPGSVAFPQAPVVTLPDKPNPVRNPVIIPGLPTKLPGESETYRPGFPRKPSSGFVINGPTQVITGWGVTIFDGYRTLYVPGYTCVSPYALYNCPPYIGSTYVITAPYRFLGGRELGSFWPWADDDRYYASNAHRGRALRIALNDLARFWEENDSRALRRRVSPDLSVAVFQDERYAYSLRQADFLGLSADALDRVRTLSFRFTNVRDRNDGLVNAYATHVYRDRDGGAARSATVRYTLVFVDGDWYVSAVSLSPDIAR